MNFHGFSKHSVKTNQKSVEIQHENARLAKGWRNQIKTHVAVGGSTEVVGICLLDRQLPLAGTTGTVAFLCSMNLFVLPLMYKCAPAHTHTKKKHKPGKTMGIIERTLTEIQVNYLQYLGVFKFWS